MLSCLLILYFMGVVRCLSMSWCAVMCANIIFYGCSEVSLYELVCCHVCALCPSLDNHHLPRVVRLQISPALLLSCVLLLEGDEFIFASA